MTQTFPDPLQAVEQGKENRKRGITHVGIKKGKPRTSATGIDEKPQGRVK